MKTWLTAGSLRSLVMILSRKKKRLIAQGCDVIAVPIVLWAAYAMRLSDWWPAFWLVNGSYIFVILPLLAIPIFAKLGLYRVITRAVGLGFLKLSALASGLAALAIYGLMYFLDLKIPRSVPIIFGLSFWAYITSSRLTAKHFLDWLVSKDTPKENVLIFGAGSAGTELVYSLGHGSNIAVKGFIDDDPMLQGATVFGSEIFPRDQIRILVERHSIRTILLAIPSASRSQRRDIIETFEDLPVKVKTVPTMSEIVRGARIESLKDIELNDLLGRDPVPPNPDLISRSIFKKSICVTGAGGSIGSEISRQCLLAGARRLVIFEISEYALYTIDQILNELRLQEGIDCDIVPVLGSVTNQELVDRTFKLYQVETVYHAAAYKHVPLVEANPIEGLHNNLFGTQVTATAAMNNGVDRFILISSDKAVRPTNVMGASKRVAELIVQDLAIQENQMTIFTMVRFGNVLGSSGSVVPLFKKQIEYGGPITVTDPNVSRFFMSVAEASSLVIQAGSMAKGGEVFLLDMGQSILIAELAKLMISLSGLSLKTDDRPNGDIEIRFTGLRPGEKLKEELLIDGSADPSDHPKIRLIRELGIARKDLKILIQGLERAVRNSDEKSLMDLLMDPAIGFTRAK
ncbi:MAG: nucleoside-diphosphate sugar epimerase/dehydratase [Rhodospirillaceae bacterium]